MSGTGASSHPSTPQQQQIEARRAKEDRVRELREQHAGPIMAALMAGLFNRADIKTITGEDIMANIDELASVAAGAADALARELMELRS